MNRTETLIQGKDNLYIFGECPHCKEPQAVIAFDFKLKKKDIPKCYCRGANGLSFLIKCCLILNCIKKNGSYCNLLPCSQNEYKANNWNVLVEESKEKVYDNN